MKYKMKICNDIFYAYLAIHLDIYTICMVKLLREEEI